MKFNKWYEKQRPILFSLATLWIIPAKFRKPLQQLLAVLDYSVASGGVFIENVNVPD